MKTKLLFFTLVLLAMGGSLFAQVGQQGIASNPLGGDLTATSASCATVQSCVWMRLPNNGSTATVTLAGTFVQTDLIELSGDGGNTWITNATLSAVGITSVSVSGFSDIRVRCSAFTSGRASVTINVGILQVQSVVSGSSSSSPSSQGPVINVTNPIYAGGALSSNADNNAQFTAAMAAFNTATNAGIAGQSSIGAPVVASNSATAATTMNISITLAAASTTLVFIQDGGTHRTFTVTDNASGSSSIFTPLGQTQNNPAVGSMSIWATAVSGQKAATQVTLTITAGGAENFSAAVMSYTGASLVYNLQGVNAGPGTSLAFAQTTTRVGSTIALGCAFFNTNVSAFTATAGSTRATIASSATAGGILAMDNSSTAIASVPLTGTFSASTNTVCQGVEIQSFGSSAQQATLYIPAGNYVYSGGLSQTQPGTIKCEPGAVLYYTGSAHAVDIGTPGAAITAATWPYFIDGCTFSGGQNATQGIFYNNSTIIEGIRNSNFVNFGPASTGVNGFWAVAGNCDQWDFEIGPQVRFWTTDFIPRNYVRNNISGCDGNSFMRVHDSEFYGLEGPLSLNNSGLSTALQAGIGLYLDSEENIVSLNSFGWLNPDIVVANSAASTTQAFGTRIDNNVIDAQLNCTGAANCFSPITFRNAIGTLIVQHNNFDMQSSGLSPIGPWDAAATVNGMRANFNQTTIIADVTPFVKLNNLAGQTNNQSSNNLCNTTGGFTATAWKPCVLAHTAGANINNFTFNVDDTHSAGAYATTTNCNVNSVSPAACGTSPSGSVVVPTTTITYTVNTTAVTANSRIILLPITDGSGLTGAPTCVAPPTPFIAYESGRVAATSFTFALPSTTGTSCWTYWIVN